MMKIVKISPNGFCNNHPPILMAGFSRVKVHQRWLTTNGLMRFFMIGHRFFATSMQLVKRGISLIGLKIALIVVHF